MDSIEILNFEGPVLQLVKDDSGLSITDQWNKTIARVTVKGLIAFIDGEISIADSSGRIWNYPIQSPEAKVSLSRLVGFAVE
jgi:hypothetical protein